MKTSFVDIAFQKLIALRSSILLPLAIAFFLLIAVANESRAFFAGYLISGVFIIWTYQKSQPRKICICLMTVLLLASSTILFFIKHDSSEGRILIYKISYQIWREHFWSGIGWGRFGIVYLSYQSEYFRISHYTPKELLLADNTQYAFNDFSQLVIMTGIGGIIGLMLACASYVILVFKVLQRSRNLIIDIVLLQTGCILIAACLTHVFESPTFQVFFLGNILILLAYIFPYRRGYISILFFLSLVGMMLYHYGWTVTHLNAINRFSMAKRLRQAGYLTEAVTELRKLYPEMKPEPEFLAEYAKTLSAYGEYREAAAILNSLITVKAGYGYYDQLGHNLEELHEWKSAEIAYRQATLMVPNRFLPRYHLFLLYLRLHQQSRAKFIGTEILTLPVKIPSPAVQHIKLSVKKALENGR